MNAGKLAAALDEIRERAADEASGIDRAPEDQPWACEDVPRLLAALDAVLAQHQPGRIVILGALCPRHEAHRHFSITGTEAADIVACQDCPATVYGSCAGCGPQVRLDLCPVRAAIAAALLGGES